MLISVEGTSKSAGPRSGKYGGCSNVVSLFLAEKTFIPKSTGVLEHCCEGETNRWFSIFRVVSF